MIRILTKKLYSIIKYSLQKVYVKFYKLNVRNRPTAFLAIYPRHRTTSGSDRAPAKAFLAISPRQRHREALTDTGLALTCLDWDQSKVCAGPYRVSNGLCRSMLSLTPVPASAASCRSRGEIARNAVGRFWTFNL